MDSDRCKPVCTCKFRQLSDRIYHLHGYSCNQLKCTWSIQIYWQRQVQKQEKGEGALTLKLCFFHFTVLSGVKRAA
jgi:hypothetical protein